MAVNVSYKNPYGYANFTDKESGEKYKIHICKANCLWAWINFYKKEDGTKMASLYSFYHDVAHLRNILKNSNFSPCLTSFTFYAKELGTEQWNAIKLIAKKGYKITIK